MPPDNLVKYVDALVIGSSVARALDVEATVIPTIVGLTVLICADATIVAIPQILFSDCVLKLNFVVCDSELAVELND